MNVDRQRYFDMAARGVLGQGEPSIQQNGILSYPTAVVAASPTVRSNIGWCCPDTTNWLIVSLLAPQDVLWAVGLPDPRDDFWYRLREAHDCADFDLFYDDYIERMHAVAKEFDLNAEVLK